MRKKEEETKQTIRPFVVEIIALPGGGKTTLIKTLIGLFKLGNLWVFGMNQDDPLGDPLTKLTMDYVKGMKRQVRSLFQQGLLMALDQKIKNALLHDIVLFEHGPNFTWLMERYWARTPARRLRENIRGVSEPDLVIYLAATPKEVRLRNATPVTRSKRLNVIYAKMEAMARRKGWVHIETTGYTREATVVEAYEPIMAAYEKHKECPQEQEEFNPYRRIRKEKKQKTQQGSGVGLAINDL